jgi:hypothetical protein
VPQYEGGRGSLEAIRSEIRHVVMQQEVHYNDRGTYAKNISEFSEWRAAPGVTVTIVNASSSGYGVYATHYKLEGVRCAFFVGSAMPVHPATAMGQLACTEPQ